MEYRGLRIAKSILFRIFLLGYGLLIIGWLWLAYLFTHESLLSWLMPEWPLHKEFLWLLTLSIFAAAKFVLFFLVLIPAIAILWTLRHLEKKPLQ